MSTKFVMNTKPGDYRVLVFQEELANNPDYMLISAEEASALGSGEVTGLDIIQARFLKTRMQEAGLAGMNIGANGVVTLPDVPGAPAVPGAPDVPAVPDAPDVPAGFTGSVEDFIKGKSSNDLRTIGESFGFNFEIETRKEMGAAIIEKMNAPVPTKEG